MIFFIFRMTCVIRADLSDPGFPINSPNYVLYSRRLYNHLLRQDDESSCWYAKRDKSR
jgi:hypothetical protein